MPLTTAQRVSLANHIRSNTDPDVVAALAGRNDTELARLYNLNSSFVVWRTNISPEEYREAINWTEVALLTDGQARIWEWVTQSMTAPIDASSANVRQGLSDTFAAGTSTRTDMLQVAKRFSNIGEQIFASGTGSNVSPGTLGFEGVITIDDIGRALNENP